MKKEPQATKPKRTSRAVQPVDPRTSHEMHVDAVIMQVLSENRGEFDNSMQSLVSVEDLRKLVLLAKDRIAKPEPKKPELSPFVSRNELISAIRTATVEREVCTPPYHYGASGNDWSRDTIKFVDADELIRWLETP